MTLFLTILGAIFLSLVLTVLILYLWLRWRLRRAFRDLNDAVKDMGEALKGLGDATPARIHMDKADGPVEFDDAEKERDLVRPLLAAGFTDLGYYRVREMPQLKTRALMNVEEAMYAAVFEMEPVGVWLDLTCKYPDGYAVTFSNSHETGADRPPDKPIYRTPGADAASLLRRMLAERRPGPFVPVTAEDLPRRVEQAYAEEMDWRAARGPSDEETRRIASRSGEAYEEGAFQLTHHLQLVQAQVQLEASLRERFFESRGITDEGERERLEDRLVFVHERRTTDNLIDLYLEGLGLGDEDDDEGTPRDRADAEARNIAGGAPPREAFMRLNSRLPRDRQAVKVGELGPPLAADVYEARWRAPGAEEEDEEL